ncbi:hypothetical protein ACTPDT_15160 [Clostridioides difficile]|nr:hypothetical protein [Clostridioides difficile]MCP6803639.1 esterase FrsA [Clostridioides difficile]MDC9344716.1 hypothetical protein [Clostridioides difficile]MDO0025357.1 hypothetical protein [Clostridioides difficile]HBE7944592.1 hypothetical protein [Clostridioides difficile]HBG0407768.1 hypothetical protein [Clostridioides difficile]
MIRPHGAVLPTRMGMAEMPVELFQSRLSAWDLQARGFLYGEKTNSI